MDHIVIPTLLVIIGVTFTSFGQLLFKKAALGFTSFSIIKMIFNWQVIGGVVLHLIGLALYVIAFKHGELSVLYPATAVCYPLIVYLGVKTLKEAFDKEKIFALTLILVGIVVTNL